MQFCFYLLSLWLALGPGPFRNPFPAAKALVVASGALDGHEADRFLNYHYPHLFDRDVGCLAHYWHVNGVYPQDDESSRLPPHDFCLAALEACKAPAGNRWAVYAWEAACAATNPVYGRSLRRENSHFLRSRVGPAHWHAGRMPPVYAGERSRWLFVPLF